jgi:hypothetical protein
MWPASKSADTVAETGAAITAAGTFIVAATDIALLDALAGARLPLRGDEPVALPGGETGVEVRDGGELLGALSLRMPLNDPMNQAKERLLRDLAAQAGLGLRSARFLEELRA